jgi:hypothetical protein
MKGREPRVLKFAVIVSFLALAPGYVMSERTTYAVTAGGQTRIRFSRVRKHCVRG